MNTLRLSTTNEDLEKAGEIIRNGGLVAFPTETVYGLGADALDAEAVRSVYAAKGRPSDNPMIVHIADALELEPLIKGGRRSVSTDALKIIGTLWPGPLTLIFPKSDIVPDATTGGLDTVAIRMPSNETARRLILAAQRPVAAPSANLSGRPSPTTAEDVLEDMDGRIDAVIMGEQCDVGIESTVLDVTGDVPVILRPGIITREWLSSILGKEVVYDKSLTVRPAEELDPENGAAESDFKPKSPGMKYKHYSPKAKVTLIDCTEDDFKQKATELGLVAVRNGQRPAMIDYGDDVRKAAHRLFADLRELDRQGYDIIFIRTLEQSGLGFSVMNRMLKSAGYDVVKD
ncbi:MAG: threonylcarbamoyl-AMP synthase [Mogibacterium sp.]|nr:threonylcarbamoyl-AMP synthase [Mogibacterium sp.]